MDTWLIAVLAVAALLVIALLLLGGKIRKDKRQGRKRELRGEANKNALRLRTTGLARKCPRS
jgi:hypothetical protein